VRQTGGEAQLALCRAPDLCSAFRRAITGHVEEPDPLAQARDERVFRDHVCPRGTLGHWLEPLALAGGLALSVTVKVNV
jgi:hypothetical protein